MSRAHEGYAPIITIPMYTAHPVLSAFLFQDCFFVLSKMLYHYNAY